MWLPYQLLGAVCWSFVNILDSLLVAHYDKRPYVLQWHQSYWSLVIFLVVVPFIGATWTMWSALLLIGGAFAYAGDMVVFTILDRVDVSVSQIGWAMMAVLLSVFAMILFGEVWSWSQIGGAVLLLGGVCLLSVWGKTLTFSHLGLLFLLAVLNVPFYLAQKAALLNGTPIVQALLWPLLAREILSFFLPMMIPSWRKRALSLFPKMNWHYFAINGAVIALFFAGVSFNTIAYAIGPLSLAAVVSNVQPFLILLFAYLIYRAFPRAPKELLTAQSLKVKIVSYCVVFCGLALLALSA